MASRPFVWMNGSVLATLALGAIATSSFGFQSGEPRIVRCCTVGSGSAASVSIDVRWEFLPDDPPEAVPAIVGAKTAEYTLGWSLCTGFCCNPFVPYFYSDSDADSGDALLAGISASAWVSPGTYAYGGLSGFQGSGYVKNSTSFRNESHYLQLDDFQQLIDPCEPHGSTLEIGLSHAVFGWKADYGSSGELLVDVSWEASGGRSSFNSCFCTPPRGWPSFDVGFPVRKSSHVMIRVVASYGDESSATQIIRGVDAIAPDLTRTRLGFFAQSDFDGTSDEDTFSGFAEDVPLSVTIDLTTAVNVSVSAEIESFDVQDGDLTPTTDEEDAICWADRVLFAAAFGSSFEDESYNPRADFDLDGDVDSDDYEQYLDVFNANACAADFNCDGVIEVPDIFAFQTVWFANEFAADFDGNELIEVADLFAFLSAWFAGC